MGYPDKKLCEYILCGLEHGFKIGFVGNSSETRPNNLLSARKNSGKVSQAVVKEVERGYTSGPFVHPPLNDLHCSPIGAVIKKDGSCRLVMDLSQPKGQSINEGIVKEEFSVVYSKFDDAIKLVWAAGQGCYMCKVDIKHAFRLLPVDPSDWKLLGYRWDGFYFVDTRLPFGLRSSPKIFNDFADLICWICQNKYGLKTLIHYSDDFFMVCGKCFKDAKRQLQTLCQAFQDMGIPLAPEKIVGPTKKIIYLGVGIDSVLMVMYITEEKYTDLSDSLPKWQNRRTCTKQHLLSLIGKLSSVSKIVQPGRIFLRRLINLSTTVVKLHHHVTLNSEAKADIEWWCQFLPSWSQSTLIPETYSITHSDLRLYSDACQFGFGAIYGNSWIQGGFEGVAQGHSIDFKELFAIVAAVMVWGPDWAGKRIVFHTDNKPITDIWQSGSTPSKDLMTLVRKLYMLAAGFQFSISFKHIMGVKNPVADAISRFQEARFRLLAPNSALLPTRIPQEVSDLLASIPVPKKKRK